MKQLNQLLNHNLSQLGKKKKRKKEKSKGKVSYDATALHLTIGIGGVLAVSLIHSNFCIAGERLGQPPVRQRDWCQPTVLLCHSRNSALASHGHTGQQMDGGKKAQGFPSSQLPLGKSRAEASPALPAPSAQNQVLYICSCGAEELLSSLHSPQDILSLGLCQKGAV